MIEFKIQYTHKGKQHNIVGITNSAMNWPVRNEAYRENQLTEVNVFKDNQRPDERWNIGPSYIHSLYFDNQGATLYFKISTGADGKIKRRDFIGMTVYEDNEDLQMVDVVNVEYSVQTRYIE
jgi:hypothetical protein